jgi:ATP-dependent Clp protease adaptor protein ClpS
MIFLMTDTDTQELTRKVTVEKNVAEHELVLFNDEVNTFDWVIVSLMEVCQHTLEQAEQCALITHHKGKCGVKSGSWEDLKPRCENLLERGLSAEII